MLPGENRAPAQTRTHGTSCTSAKPAAQHDPPHRQTNTDKQTQTNKHRQTQTNEHRQRTRNEETGLIDVPVDGVDADAGEELVAFGEMFATEESFSGTQR